MIRWVTRHCADLRPRAPQLQNSVQWRHHVLRRGERWGMLVVGRNNHDKGMCLFIVSVRLYCPNDCLRIAIRGWCIFAQFKELKDLGRRVSEQVAVRTEEYAIRTKFASSMQGQLKGYIHFFFVSFFCASNDLFHFVLNASKHSLQERCHRNRCRSIADCPRRHASVLCSGRWFAQEIPASKGQASQSHWW